VHFQRVRRSERVGETSCAERAQICGEVSESLRDFVTVPFAGVKAEHALSVAKLSERRIPVVKRHSTRDVVYSASKRGQAC
jgi:hypothetical protein